jgi:hypothetical protein
VTVPIAQHQADPPAAVSLQPAYSFTCRKCGERNYVSPVPVEFDAAALRLLRKLRRRRPNHPGPTDFGKAPAYVGCGTCRTVHRVAACPCG